MAYTLITKQPFYSNTHIYMG